MADTQGNPLNPKDTETASKSSGKVAPGEAGAAASAGAAGPASDATATDAATQTDSVSAADLAGNTESLLQQTEAGLAAAVAPDLGAIPGIPAELGPTTPYQFRDLADAPPKDEDRLDLDMLHDVELDLRIELGRAELLVDEVLSLKEGSVVPLDKLAGDPVDILVNGRLIARGEVLVLNDNFCVRVAEILTPE